MSVIQLRARAPGRRAVPSAQAAAPQSPGAPGGQAAPSVSKPDGEAAARGLSARRGLLIVEDEWIVSMDLELLLTGAGHEVVGIAATAAEAIALAERLQPRLVLMDIRLAGGSDGIEAAVEIRRRFGIPSLFVSANTDPGTRIRAEAAAALGWVSKPYSEPALLAGVAAALAALEDGRPG